MLVESMVNEQTLAKLGLSYKVMVAALRMANGT
jgi:hypothetical protein